MANLLILEFNRSAIGASCCQHSIPSEHVLAHKLGDLGNQNRQFETNWYGAIKIHFIQNALAVA